MDPPQTMGGQLNNPKSVLRSEAVACSTPLPFFTFISNKAAGSFNYLSE